MSAAPFTARELSDALRDLLVKVGPGCSERELHAVEQAVLRLQGHEWLTTQMLPDWRGRLERGARVSDN